MEKAFVTILKVLSWLLLISLFVFTLYPVIYTLLGSLKTNAELTLGKSILPEDPQWVNYIKAFKDANFFQYGLNSLIVSSATMAIAVLTSSLSGYVLARYKFAGKKLMLSTYQAMMFVTIGPVALYPIMNMLSKIGMEKSMLSLILVLTGGQITNVFLVMGFVQRLPRELDEAATIDGCSIFRVYGQIILPLTKPILGVVALFTFHNTWNDYITSLILTMSNRKLTTLTVAVVQLKYSVWAAAEWHIMLAGASLAIIPVLSVYIFTNKQFMSGLMEGAVKG